MQNLLTELNKTRFESELPHFNEKVIVLVMSNSAHYAEYKYKFNRKQTLKRKIRHRYFFNNSEV